MKKIIIEVSENSHRCHILMKLLRGDNYIFSIENESKALSQPLVSGTLPTEEQVLQTIFDCVFIRGIELEDYKRNFTNEQSGLYDALVKLFSGNDANRLLAAVRVINKRF